MQWKVEWFFYKKVPPKIDQSYVKFSVNNHPKWTKLSKKITKENKSQDLLLFEKVCPAQFYISFCDIFWVFWIHLTKTEVQRVCSFLYRNLGSYLMYVVILFNIFSYFIDNWESSTTTNDNVYFIDKFPNCGNSAPFIT